MSEELRAKLQGELSEVGWRDLRQHAARGALFLVAPSLDLVEATLAVAVDDRVAVEGWVSSGALVRPGEAQLAAWEREPDKRFAYLIAQPFVFAREI